MVKTGDVNGTLITYVSRIDHSSRGSSEEQEKGQAPETVAQITFQLTFNYTKTTK